MSAGGETWGEWIANSAFLTALGGIATWFANVIIQRWRHRDEAAEKQQAREDRLTEHTSGLAIELLKIANSEVLMLKEQIAHLSGQMTHVSDLERRLGYFEEALFHIEQLINVDQSLGRAAAENNARTFLGKMIILREVKGIAGNREQSKRAGHRLEGKGEME